METKIKINGQDVRIDDETLAAINVALKSCPIVTNSYNNKTEKYEDVVKENQRLEIIPVFALENKFTTVP